MALNRQADPEVAVRVVSCCPAPIKLNVYSVLCRFAATLLLFFSVVPWRQATFFSGQLDSGCNGKARSDDGAVFGCALGQAQRHAQWPVDQYRPGAAPSSRCPVLRSSDAGAFLFGSLLPSVELSVRVLVVGFVVLSLIELVGPMVAMACWYAC